MRVLLSEVTEEGWVGIAGYVLQSYIGQFDSLSNCEIIVKNFNNKKDTDEEIINTIEDVNPEIVGFTCYIWNIKRTLQICEKLDCRIVLGGPHVTDIAQKLLQQYQNIDYIIIGEGEKPLFSLLQSLNENKKLKDVAGLVVQSIYKPCSNIRKLPIVVNKAMQKEFVPTDPLSDINLIPPFYERIFKEETDIKSIVMETSRGCPLSCSYCAWGEKKMRYYNVDRILEELDFLESQVSVENIYFSDSSLFLKKDRAKKILGHMIATNMKTPVHYELNMRNLDEDMINLVVQLPSHSLNFGLQAVSQEANEKMRRHFNAKEFKKRFNLLAKKKSKEQILAIDIIYPLPGDTLETFCESIDFVMALDGLNVLKFNPLILLPGTEYYRNREEFAIVTDTDEGLFVEETYSFSRNDVRLASKYAYFTLVIHLNPKLKRAIVLLAKLNSISISAQIIDFMESLPFSLYEKQVPRMLTSVIEQERYYVDAIRSLRSKYINIIEFFLTYSRHIFDDDLKEWEQELSDWVVCDDYAP